MKVLCNDSTITLLLIDAVAPLGWAGLGIIHIPWDTIGHQSY